jgi:menaquinone-dependent protoporphyrinogen oxidase
MRVLVTAASRHGATWEIAEAIGRTISEQGVQSDVIRLEEVTAVDPYGAVVLGSAVYVGNWLEPARTFVNEHQEELVARPTWLFSSGPIGDPPRPTDDKAVQIDALVEATKPLEHRLFAGKLDRDKLSFGERAVVFAFRAAEGDFRDWEEIAAWAAGIAQQLQR